MRITNTSGSSASSPRLVLYKRDGSPPSNAVRMVGALLGLQLDFKEPDLLKLEHRTEEFKKINPMATIPVLQDGDFIFAESHAIVLYLVNKYGGEQRAPLYPFDPQTRAVVHQCLHFDAGVMFRRLQDVAKPTLLAKKPGPTEQDISDIEDAYASLEAFLQGRRYVACEHLTVADVTLGSTVTAMQWIHALDPERFPNSKRWLEQLEAEPVFKEINEPGATAFGKMNPMGTVPVLKDGDFFISDSHAIMLYLVRKCGGAHKETLYPAERRTRALVDRALHFDTGVVFRQLLDVIKATFARTMTGPTPSHVEQISETYAALEAFLESRPYVAAGHVTVADVSLGSSVAALERILGLDAEKFPRTREWLDRMQAESYFKEIGTPCAHRLAAILKTIWSR